MCPLCLTTLTLAVSGVLCAGGASAFAITRLRGQRRVRPNPQPGRSQERAA
ncbi:hypothetical protein ACAW63_10700 [Pseudomonas sp. QE6]|uniref:hypothetical protein n=1 Tax=Pseudomonas sp. QE6 TaxID=3242491 RepID=UPI0035298003